MMYGGEYIRQSLPMSNRTVESAPKRLVPPGHAPIFARNSDAIRCCASDPAGRKGALTFSLASMGEPTKPLLMKAMTRPSQSSLRTHWMPYANASMICGCTRDMSPKSRKTSRPSSASIRLPSCGSACTMPVSTRLAVTASTAM